MRLAQIQETVKVNESIEYRRYVEKAIERRNRSNEYGIPDWNKKFLRGMMRFYSKLALMGGMKGSVNAL